MGLFGEQYKYVNDLAFNFKFFASHIDNVVIRDVVYHLFMLIDKFLIIIAAISAYLTKEKWKETLLLSLSIIWFTIHSGFYMGLFFFAGIVFFLNDAKKNWVNNLCFICIILILNPVQFILLDKYNITHAFTNVGASSLAGILILDILFSFIKNRSIRNKSTSF